ncbi:hypothetical protein BC828DRAFT_348732 [Blastocladiella britannica]|nr:hypothetical protein BC828DRAFT_348732 [Blastocladiella britannica]
MLPNLRYTPLWTRGLAREKEGLCRLCPPESWFKIKISAYWYHLNFYHGISSVTGLPFQGPVAARFNELLDIREAKCHNCKRWVPIDTARHAPVNIPEIYWWKHAQKCHCK